MHAFTHADVMNQLAAREQLRLKDIPSLEQINAKDGDLGQLLSKLTTSISGRRVDVTGGQVRGCGIERRETARKTIERKGREAGWC